MKLGRKDYTISVKTGTDANKAKFKKECVQGEIYHATDTGFFYIAEVTAGASDATLSKFGAAAFTNQYSVSLDGSDDYINVPHATSLNLNSGMTLSAWVYWNSLTGYPMIFNKRTLSQHTYQLYQNGNKLRFNNGSVVTSNTTLSTGAWFHCAVTCTSGGTVIFYLNGSADGGGNAAGSISTNTNPLEIGGMSWAANRTNGFIDEASVFNSVLSASDITSIYNSGVPADISSLNPVGWWRMGDNDGGTGTTITDQGSGGNNGTLTNGPTFSTTVPS